jgi:hypothetical protein
MIFPSTSCLTFAVTSLRSGAIRQPLLVPFLSSSFGRVSVIKGNWREEAMIGGRITRGERGEK